MTRPLVGVPGMWSSGVHGMRFAGVAVAVEVLRSIDRAGGEPVVLFPGSSETPAEQLGRVDAVVFPGGADVDPARYGGAPDEHYWPADYPGQDGYEAALLEEAIARRIPVLAICRGLQLLNVVRGGTLLPHLEPGAVTHRDAVHGARVQTGSLLATVVGPGSVPASSYHHQAVDAVGGGLVVAARADDGVVEALELPGSPLLAVQWHPEDLAATSPTDHGLFEWVVDAGRARSAHALPVAEGVGA